MMRRARCVALLLSIVACRDATTVVPRQQVAGGDARRGARAIMIQGCGSCHVIPGVPAATGRVGPSLAGLADRSHLAGGRVQNAPDALVHWIRFPSAVSPGTLMPDLGITDADARDIAAYLYTLSGGRNGPPFVIAPSRIPSH